MLVKSTKGSSARWFPLTYPVPSAPGVWELKLTSLQKRDAEEKASLLESHVKTVDSLSDTFQARIRDLEASLEKSREEVRTGAVCMWGTGGAGRRTGWNCPNDVQVVERDTQLAELSSTLQALQVRQDW
jgi:hypothetical protein